MVKACMYYVFWNVSTRILMSVRVLFAACGFVGFVVSEKAASVSSVYCF